VPKNEDGEFELILANRQLLSVFFIVVVLLGVFFTMGYIVGRNSGPAQVEVAAARKPEPKATDTPASETAAPVSAPPVETPVVTRPQREPEVRPEPKPEPPVKKEPPAKKEKTKEKADVMVDVLHQKKFKAMAVEIPEKPGLFRVLVGPLADGTLNKTKSDLQSSGFPGDKAIKKVY
jgi:outer membrane biosynthesis protein TonB